MNSPIGHRRGASPVVGTIIMVAVVVILASTISVFVLNLGSSAQSTAPQVSVSYELVEDGGERTIAVTMEASRGLKTDQLYVTASKRLDIGGSPGSGSGANDAYASELERFTESSGGNPPQVGIGDTWDAGETIYLDPEGSASDVTVRIYWSASRIRSVNPGIVSGDDSYKIAEFTV
ncbi:type IV pilin [Halorussus pelagicus]|uniref:type IV pilin n=1 Tax=Halorussus pelagicus TaxID=2505977 RepID=UPI000FFB1CE4|nr:type IV pilin N-terminal domain-containing protein [Halorussus pelagicus]